MIALVFGGNAWAWNQVQGSTCGDASWASATTAITYRINSNDFSAAERTEIELAGDAWRAGSGQLVRGATWRLTRGADTTSDGSSSSVDGINAVARKPSTFFSSAGTYATTRLWVDSSSCELVEADVYVNSAPLNPGPCVG